MKTEQAEARAILPSGAEPPLRKRFVSIGRQTATVDAGSCFAHVFNPAGIIAFEKQKHERKPVGSSSLYAPR